MNIQGFSQAVQQVKRNVSSEPFKIIYHTLE
jgi:hypothetical protein